MVSVLLGLGFTFFSGAVEAWLVDALTATGFKGSARVGVRAGPGGRRRGDAGGVGRRRVIAQVTNLGVPFILRAVVLAMMFVFAFVVMRDVGFTPRARRAAARDGTIAGASIEYGWRVPSVKWLMLASPFTAGVGVYSFYALQPYLLELYGDPKAYGIAGLVAAIVAGAQIVGGFAAPWIRELFRRRTSALLAATAASSLTLALIGAFENFWSVLGLIVVWGLLFAASMPIRQTLPQRADPLGAAGDHPVLRLHARLDRRAWSSSRGWGAPRTSGATGART